MEIHNLSSMYGTMGWVLSSHQRNRSKLSYVVGSYECISSVLALNVKDSSVNDLDGHIKYYKKD